LDDMAGPEVDDQPLFRQQHQHQQQPALLQQQHQKHHYATADLSSSQSIYANRPASVNESTISHFSSSSGDTGSDVFNGRSQLPLGLADLQPASARAFPSFSTPSHASSSSGSGGSAYRYITRFSFV
jgi:hypothetical protein